jgi:hypothetical protein
VQLPEYLPRPPIQDNTLRLQDFSNTNIPETIQAVDQTAYTNQKSKMHPTQSTNKKKKQTNPNPRPAPPPYYLSASIPPAYCHTCGRVISSRRNTAAAPTKKPQQQHQDSSSTAATKAAKFCSDRCKRHKPSLSPTSAEVHVEKALVALLEGQEPPPPYVKTPTTITGTDTALAENGNSKPKPMPKPQRKKGETRVLLPLSVLEEAVFGSRSDPERAYGRRKNRAFRGVREDGEWRSVDMEDDGSDGDDPNITRRPEPISTWEGAEDFDGEDLEVEGGVRLSERRDWDEEEDGGAGAEPETPELAARRRAGQKKAEEREFVRCVVRRAVVFGVEVEGWEDIGSSGGGGKKGKKGKGRRDAESEDEDVQSEVKPRRKCEAVMSGQVVEPSFAKGDWSVRWRDE